MPVGATLAEKGSVIGSSSHPNPFERARLSPIEAKEVA
jgi:hypothetical protein